MSLSLTPQMLASAYDFLCTCPPFKGWKLPHSDEVEFCVTLHRDREGDHAVCGAQRNHILRVSDYHINTVDGLMQVMAHEMIHAHQRQRRTASNDGHNAEFKRIASRVCAIHGWDKEKF